MSNLTNRIEYIPENNKLVYGFPETHFNSLTELCVPENCEAVLFLSGKALDVLSSGEYTLETRNIPLAAQALCRSEGDMTEFDCGVCFVNKAASVSVEFESEQGKKGTATVSVGDSAKLISGLLAFTDLEEKSVTDFIERFLKGSADDENGVALEDIGLTGTVDITFIPETVQAPVQEIKIEPEITETKKSETKAKEPETEEKPKKKSPALKIALILIIVGVAICLAVAIFFKPPADKPEDNGPQTVVDETSPEIPEFDREITITDIAAAKDGDFVEFGTYKYDAGEDAEAVPLVWEVIGEEDGNLVLITRHCIDTVPYNVADADIEWKECSLRKWLNGEFYKTAFTADEQAKMVVTTNKNALDTNYTLENGNNPDDNVYLLSITEVKSYFAGAEDLRKAKATPYAVSRGAYVDESVTGCCRWWLRSPGDMPNSAAFVEGDGYVGNYGDGVTNPLLAVRPVIRISVR